ncbi:MAG TPA: hypothetical protein VHV30_11605 [Polyangiaceae bacterium]|jgi:hypothetical protein|nr:hypothetical protein [Polyangiaceae bacterium]
MRGFLAPAVRSEITDHQRTFQGLSRHRRMKLARAAHTTLIKADQWGRGGATASEVAQALETGLKTLTSKKK